MCQASWKEVWILHDQQWNKAGVCAVTCTLQCVLDDLLKELRDRVLGCHIGGGSLELVVLQMTSFCSYQSVQLCWRWLNL